ncbi:MAG: hypothetical protein ABID87_07615 [Chloroflexota bacterium]
MNLLLKAGKEISTPETYRKGEDFESYVRQHLFPKDKYILLDKTHNYASNRDDFVESTKNPDFKFKSPNGITFFIEAKFRSGYFNDKIEWGKPYQLWRYRKINRQTPVYVVIGVGANPSNPDQLYLIPVKNIPYTGLFPSFLRQYELPPRKCVPEALLT